MIDARASLARLALVSLIPFASACTAEGADDVRAIVVRDSTGREVRPFAPPAGRCHCLLFVTVDCPIANGYAPTIQSIVAEFTPRAVDFWLVHVDPDVDAASAAAHAEAYGHATPFVLDHEHRLVGVTGATITPEAVVVVPTSELIDDPLAYRGRIDNWYGDLGAKRPRATRHELREALTAVLAGRPPNVPRTDAVGCFISDLRRD